MSNLICWKKIKAIMLAKKIKYIAAILTLVTVFLFVTVNSDKNSDVLNEEKSENINDVSRKLRQLQEENDRLQNIIEKEKTKDSGVDLQQLSEQLNKMHNENLKLQEIVSNIKTADTKKYPNVKFLPEKDRKRILVTGGAGFVGSHLVDRLMIEGNEVTVVDNFFTGRKRNIEHWIGHENFELINHDIVSPLYLEVDEIYHLACPASPPHYMYNPIKTIKTSSIGTLNMLGLAKRVNAVLLLASSSEVYGDPEVHPQTEEYWGHVNPIGPRACYDEGKRVAETMCYSYHNQDGVEVRIARIFNTYGPRMHMADGRVVSNFILQALQNEPMTVYGSGTQTRSFQYVSDLVDGLIRLMNSNVSSPVNIGNHEEHTIIEFAQIIKKMTNSDSEILHKEAAIDDPQKRKPDVRKAARELNWKPVVALSVGLNKTIAYFSDEIRQSETNKRNMYYPTVKEL